MDNNENNKNKKFKRALIIFIVVLALIIAIALPYSILSLNKDDTKTDGLNKAKDVKDYECTKKGQVCSFEEMYEGVEVNVEVAKGEIYTFSMIANDEDTMTLMLQQNIIDDIEWHEEGINMKGPQTSLYKLNEQLQNWTYIENIKQYSYTDKGKLDTDAFCSTAVEPTLYECPTSEYDTRGYNGITITDGEIKLLYNLPPDEIVIPDAVILTEGTIRTTGKVRFITLEEYETFVTDDGPAKWLIEDLETNEGYWTMTTSPILTTGYNQGAYAIINRNSEPDTENVPVARGNEYFKVGLRPVITVDKK